MIAAPEHPHEARRLAALESLGILFTPAEERFDRITRLCCRIFGVPVALVSLVAEGCQWFKSRQGLSVASTPRHISFCAHAILQDEPLIVPDALLDERFHDNPLVTGEPHIRFYAGCPLSDSEGNKLGTLCLIDRKPRDLSAEEIDTLVDLASWAEAELRAEALGEARRDLLGRLDAVNREARVDVLTQTWNRRALGEILERELARAARQGGELSIFMVDLDHFKDVNDRYGHEGGDETLRRAAAIIRSRLRAEDAICRFGGEEFVAILPDCDLDGGLALAEKIRARMEAEDFSFGGKVFKVTASFGVARHAAGSGEKADSLLARADKALYRAKQGGRNRVEAG